jgi:hypothetical protein
MGLSDIRYKRFEYRWNVAFRLKYMGRRRKGSGHLQSPQPPILPNPDGSIVPRVWRLSLARTSAPPKFKLGHYRFFVLL